MVGLPHPAYLHHWRGLSCRRYNKNMSTFQSGDILRLLPDSHLPGDYHHLIGKEVLLLKPREQGRRPPLLLCVIPIDGSSFCVNEVYSWRFEKIGHIYHERAQTPVESICRETTT